MNWDAEQFTKMLRQTVAAFDKKGAAAQCRELIAYLYATSDPYPPKEAERVLQILRNKRMFLLLQQVGDALIQTGRDTFKIRRQYAQALIDQGNLTAALAVLDRLIADTSALVRNNADEAEENVEAWGLIGRTYKQMYINANSPSNPRNRDYLDQAVSAYYGVYKSAPETHLWHGINVVALLRRAARDGFSLPAFPDATTLAEAILSEIEDRDLNGRANTWDFATAVECCIALEKPADALTWVSHYIRMPSTDAFELASTLRQFTEVWQLDMQSELGKQILPILRAELLAREGGQIAIDVQELRQEKLESCATTAIYEKVFGNDSFNSYNWYLKGVDRCGAVARIGRDPTHGEGTGFLIVGKALHEKLGDNLVLLTNAHVVSDNPDVHPALRSDEAVIIFEVHAKDEFKIGSILWSSPPSALDATIILFSPEDQLRVRELVKDVPPYPIAKVLPGLDPPHRVYIIGHPAGGTLCLSLQDNILLDYESPLIHYRTPTKGGSSGSPVFNRQWELIGVHHKGDENMRMLNEKSGTYQANEGIWISTIIAALARELAEDQAG